MPVHIDEDGPVNLYTEPETCRYTLTCVEYVLFRTNPIPFHPSPLTPSFLFPPTHVRYHYNILYWWPTVRSPFC